MEPFLKSFHLVPTPPRAGRNAVSIIPVVFLHLHILSKAAEYMNKNVSDQLICHLVFHTKKKPVSAEYKKNNRN